MKNIIYNTALGLNCLMLFLVLFGTSLAIPTWLQVAGRMHPLLLHFPIVLLVLAVIWEFQRKKITTSEDGIADWILLSAAFSAALSALMGLFLSQEAGYNAEAIAWHKWTGIAVSLISFGWFTYKNIIRQSKLLSRIVSGASLVALVMAGHQGATITHGEDFLTAPLKYKSEAPQRSVEDAIIYNDLVKPILEKKCINCHNSQKSKGELVMETPEQLLKGGKNGKLWDVNAANLGLMMQRIHLPIDDEDHMPPVGKPQLTREEMAILYHWIKSGSDFNKKVRELADTDTLKILATAVLKPKVAEIYNFNAADKGTIKKLNTNYRVITPLSLGSPALSVDFFGASQFNSAQLRELLVIRKQIVSLNLNKMPVTDEDLKTIAGFENLRTLNLSFTQITGANLSVLKNLKFLKTLSLSGTGVKSTDIAFIHELPAIEELHLWNTNLSQNDITALKSTLSRTRIEAGFNGDTIIARLGMPILENDEVFVFQEDTKIKLKHYVKGAVIRYTLDGTVPDSLTSSIYTDEGILIHKTAILTAKAYLDGWISSDNLIQQFYKAGFVADSVRLAHQPNPQYTGKAKTLFDGKLGDNNFKSGKWLGYRETAFEAYIYFKQPVTASKVTFSTLMDVGSYIMPAQELQVWGGNSTSDLVLLKKINPKQPLNIEALILKGFECSFDPRKVRVLKLVGKPIPKLPLWHPGKGDKGWFFIGEIFVN
jgi:uncharacterized membrane protein/mono/diheme cytochrome c family protein